MLVALCAGCLYDVDSMTPLLRMVNEYKPFRVTQGWANNADTTALIYVCICIRFA